MKHPVIDPSGTWLGRVERAGIGPCVVTVRDGLLHDITNRSAPTVRDILEGDDPVNYVRGVQGQAVGAIDNLPDSTSWLAPCDLQSVKACGVTFAGSMVERVIEEQAAGDPQKAEDIRSRVADSIGDSLSNITPGSKEAAELKVALMAEGCVVAIS